MSLLHKLQLALLKPLVKNWSKQRLPKIEGEIQLLGLKNTVEIKRDQWGIPHIYAQNLHDVIFAQGFVHAQDRLWQMELNRRVSRGQLSEFLGEDALSTDVASRIMGFERTAKKDITIASKDEINIVQHYCDGINAFINQAQKYPTVEFKLTKLEPNNWEVLDVIAFNRLLISQMSWGWYDEIVRAKLIEAVGEAAAAELNNGYPLGNPITLPDGIEFNQIKMKPGLDGDNLNIGPKISGSNAWTISGDRTETGKPMLCNDPHLAISNPGIWYEIHLNCPELHSRGVSIPGAPLVLIGHNANIGWGITLAYTDIEDVFIEKFTDDSCQSYEHIGETKQTVVHEELIKIKGKQPHVEEVLETVHGVVISDLLGSGTQKLTLCSMALKEGRPMLAWLKLNHAKNWDDFKEAVSYATAPGLNIVYADIEDNIGYYTSGKNPMKTKDVAALPQVGWSGEADWKRFVPFDEMPHVFNPEKGYVLTCNNKIEPENFPHFLGDIYMNGNRADRLEDLLTTKQKFDQSDFLKMQMDFHSKPGKKFAELFKEIKFDDSQLAKYAKILSDWDGNLNKETIGGTLYKVTDKFAAKYMYETAISDQQLIDELFSKAFHPVFGPISTFLGYSSTTLFKILTNDQSWWNKKAGGKEKILEEGLSLAVEWLTKNYGSNEENWMWGNVNAIVMDHSLSVKEPLGKIFDLGPYPIGGDGDTPHQCSTVGTEGFGGHLIAPSYRQIIDFSDFDKSTSILPGGQSGNLMSLFYDDQVQDWLAGKSHPMCWSEEQVERHTRYKLMLHN